MLKSDGKTYYSSGNKDKTIVHIVSPKYAANEMKRGRAIDYAVWERVSDTRAPLEIIMEKLT